MMDSMQIPNDRGTIKNISQSCWTSMLDNLFTSEKTFLEENKYKL